MTAASECGVGDQAGRIRANHFPAEWSVSADHRACLPSSLSRDGYGGQPATRRVTWKEVWCISVISTPHFRCSSGMITSGRRCENGGRPG